MDETTRRRLIAGYLRDVEAALAGLPATQRREILSDLRTHIDDALASIARPSEADLRNVLERLGAPAGLARAARERPGVEIPAPAPVPAEGVLTRRPGLLEIAAIIATVLVFPVGLMLAAISGQWRTRDKLIATAIPGTAFALPTLAHILVSLAGTATVLSLPFGHALPRLFVGTVLPFMFLSPLLAAGYLMLRLRATPQSGLARGIAL